MRRPKAAFICKTLVGKVVLLAALAVTAPALAQNSADGGLPSSAKPAPPPQIAAPAPPANVSRTPSVTSLGGYAGFQGLRVRDIQFRGVMATPADRLMPYLVQKANEPLDRNKVRRSLQALYATGKFADIQVEADRPSQDEVSLVFSATENQFIGAIYVYGLPKGPPSANQLINASKLQLGELLTQEKIDQAPRRMKRVLNENGYHRASITMERQPHPETQQVDMHFHLVPGAQARVGRVIVNGEPGYSEDEIRGIAKLHPGDRVLVEHVTRALQRLRKKYQKQDRLEAQVSITDRTYHPENNTLDYTFKIVRGPKIDIKVEGAKLRKRLLKKYVPVYEEGAVDDDLLNEGRRNIRDYFQTKGYFDVDVDFTRHDQGPDHRSVIFDINRGQRHKLTDIVIDGNKYFDQDLLRERMVMQPAGWLLSHGRYSQSILSRDVGSIENLYRANGFQQIKITSDVQDDYKGEKGRMRVVLHIYEGPQTRVASLKLVGNNNVSAQEINNLLSSIEGQPFSDMNVATDRDSVMNYYYNHGFPDATFESAAAPMPGNPNAMNVTYTIKEGEQQFVDHILMSGLLHTWPFVVDREVSIRPQEPLDQSKMLDSQRRLYDLGIFNQVDMAVQNPEGHSNYKNVLLQMQEAKRYTFRYGLGFEVQSGSNPVGNQPQGRTGISPRVTFEVTRLNFRGRDHTISLKSQYGRLQRRGLISYDAPRWFDRENLRLTFTGFYDNTRDVRTFTAERLEGSVQAQQIVSRVTTLLYRFSYRRVKVDPNSIVISPADIPLFSRPVRVGMPSLTYIRDRRDDPIDAHKGNYTTADIGLASSAFGSQTNFGRILLQNSTYQTFGKKKYVFARSSHLGIESPYGQNALIPLPERFFGGGGNSHRGFAINQAGPRDLTTGFPLGGDAMFINNFELRLPPTPLPFVQDNLSFVLFEDAGNVFANSGKILGSIFRFSQPNKSTCSSTNPIPVCDFNYFSHAVGAGVRYKTPIGPVRVDFSYNLNPPTFPIRSQFVDKVFVPTISSQTLKRFNFFFSIGQTF